MDVLYLKIICVGLFALVAPDPVVVVMLLLSLTCYSLAALQLLCEPVRTPERISG